MLHPGYALGPPPFPAAPGKSGGRRAWVWRPVAGAASLELFDIPAIPHSSPGIGIQSDIAVTEPCEEGFLGCCQADDEGLEG